MDNQLRAGDPPETKQTYKRLRAAGYSDEDARLLIGNVVMHEIYAMLKTQRQWDLAGFVAMLRRMPKLPD